MNNYFELKYKVEFSEWRSFTPPLRIAHVETTLLVYDCMSNAASLFSKKIPGTRWYAEKYWKEISVWYKGQQIEPSILEASKSKAASA